MPRAIAESLTSGQLGIFEYYKLRNLQADTDMRRTIATGTTAGTSAVQ
ncbi:MAG: flotillin-like FloA family protein [Planctomycetia bacterium]